jgi:hypothetical protein
LVEQHPDKHLRAPKIGPDSIHYSTLGWFQPSPATHDSPTGVRKFTGNQDGFQTTIDRIRERWQATRDWLKVTIAVFRVIKMNPLFLVN